MRNFILINALILSIFISLAPASVSESDISINVTRLSDRVIVLSHASLSELTINVIAVSTTNGIVVIDTSWLPVFANKCRELIIREFENDNFAYIINTHYHFDHSGGNQAFPGATVIGQENAWEDYLRFEDRAPALIENIKKQAMDYTNQLKSLRAGTPEYEKLFQIVKANELFFKDFNGEIPFPSHGVTFAERLTLDLGDMHFKLYFYGKAHTDDNIFIYIPEEGLLLTGDVFYNGWFQIARNPYNKVIQRWLSVQSEMLKEDQKLDYVIGGHLGIMSRDHFLAWNKYTIKLLDDIETIVAEGLSLEETQKRLAYDKGFNMMDCLDPSPWPFDRQHAVNVEILWKMIRGEN